MKWVPQPEFRSNRQAQRPDTTHHRQHKGEFSSDQHRSLQNWESGFKSVLRANARTTDKPRSCTDSSPLVERNTNQRYSLTLSPSRPSSMEPVESGRSLERMDSVS